jgi:F0F1-type ATP synthase membrane subunit b/b'
MFATILGFLFMLSGEAASGGSTGGTWESIREFWKHYFDYPGFEIWKFMNLAIFVTILYYVSKKMKLSDSFKAKREEIRAEIIQAEADKKAALEELTKVESRLVGVDSEKDEVMRAARTEIDEEKQRLAEQGAAEARRIEAQADGEIARLGQVAKLELRRFSIDESLRMADEKLRAGIDAKTDAKLIKSGIRSIGGLN